MWIYSLGVTLHKTIPSSTSSSLELMTISTTVANGNEFTTTFNGTSLDHVIYTMCEKNLKNRASLMYLLDVSRKNGLFF